VVVCRGTRPPVMTLVEVRLCWRGVEEDWFVWETFFLIAGLLGLCGAGSLGYNVGFSRRIYLVL